MNYRDGTSSHPGLSQSQQGLGHSDAHGPSSDHKSICSTDSRNAKGPLNVGEVGVVTPAQAYASAVKMGKTHDHALNYTIERRQPERKGKTDPQSVSSHVSDHGSAERGLSFAQRLYASALNSKSSTLPSSNITVLPPIKHASSSPLPTSDGSQASCGVSHRETSLSTTLFDTSSEVSQSFGPCDLYHSSVATHGFSLRGSTSLEVSATRSLSLFPMTQIPNSPTTRLLHLADPRASRSSSKNLTLDSDVQNSRPLLPQSQAVSTTNQFYNTPISIHEHLRLRGVSAETQQDFHPPAVALGAAPSPSPSKQQLMIPPSYSPPPFEEHERLPAFTEEVAANVTPVIMRPPVAVPLEDDPPDSSLQLPPEGSHVEVPLYSLVDEQPPPPAFDDLQETSASGAPSERPPVVCPEFSTQEVIETPSSPSLSASQSPPPFSHGSTVYIPRNAPAYALLGKTSCSVFTSENTPHDTKIQTSSIIIGYPSDPSTSNSPSVVPIDFRRSNQPLPTSPPISPSSPVPHDETAIPFMAPLQPSSSHSVSVSPSHSPENQSARTSCDPLAIRRSTTDSPPVVNYHTKPTAMQSRQPFFGPRRPPEGSSTVRQGRHDSRPIINVAEDNGAVDALTRSMFDMMGAPLSDARSPMYENLPSGRHNVPGTSIGNQQNIPIITASHPSGTSGSPSQETYRPEAERLIKEACRRPTHAETAGKPGYGIQGFGLANPPVVTNILSSQHSPLTIPSLDPIPTARLHDELQRASVRVASDGLTLKQFGETTALSSSRSSYSDRPHIPSVLPTRSFSYPLQPSHYSFDRDVHESVVPSGSAPPQQQKIYPLEILDQGKRGGHVHPPPPIPLQPRSALQTPQTSSYSQDSAKDQFGPGTNAPALNSNDLARKFAHDTLLAPSGTPAHAFYGTNRR